MVAYADVAAFFNEFSGLDFDYSLIHEVEEASEDGVVMSGALLEILGGGLFELFFEWLFNNPEQMEIGRKICATRVPVMIFIRDLSNPGCFTVVRIISHMADPRLN